MNCLTNNPSNVGIKNAHLLARNGAITGTVIGLSKATSNIILETFLNYKNNEAIDEEHSLVDNMSVVIKTAAVFCMIGLI
ncbi:MAG: hypothetical protein Q8K60_03040, partial [Parachlamydiaceae bacterium]|nr:hypothetical protein [Parachlamydiaceae bacterium]